MKEVIGVESLRFSFAESTPDPHAIPVPRNWLGYIKFYPPPAKTVISTQIASTAQITIAGHALLIPSLTISSPNVNRALE